MSQCKRKCCIEDEREALESRLDCLCVVCTDWIEEHCTVTEPEEIPDAQATLEAYDQV